MSTVVKNKPIFDSEYLRERLAPNRRDLFYLHLSDLLSSIKRIATADNIKIFDYGCGNSPYKSFFPNSLYHRADYLSLDGSVLDFVCEENSKVSGESDFYDLVLSTQVVEHLKEPDTYFQEAYRLLKKGGKLYCSTHGTFIDHGCPYDFQRWTIYGLIKEVEKQGFKVIRAEKHTLGTRAMISLMQLIPPYFPKNTITHFLFNPFVRLFVKMRKLINYFSDVHHTKLKIRDSDLENSEGLYIGIAILAQKE